MDKEQALAYVHQFTPEQLTRLTVLLEDVLRTQTGDQCGRKESGHEL